MIKAENSKIAEKVMNNTVENIPANIERQHGAFNYMRLDSRKSHTLQQVQNAI
jgi:translation initiation factor 2 subunit 1